MEVKYRSSNKTNDYYTIGSVNAKQPVTVVHTKFDTLVCLTDLTLRCKHTRAVAEFIADGGAPTPDQRIYASAKDDQQSGGSR